MTNKMNCVKMQQIPQIHAPNTVLDEIKWPLTAQNRELVFAVISTAHYRARVFQLAFNCFTVPTPIRL